MVMACSESWARTRRSSRWSPRVLRVCWNPAPPSPYGLDQLALASSVAEREAKRTRRRRPEGRRPVPHTLRKTPRLIIITFYERLTQRLSRSDAAPWLSESRADALRWLGLVRLVAPTHVVIRRRLGQAPERDKVNSDLSCWSEGAEGAGCWTMAHTHHL